MGPLATLHAKGIQIIQSQWSKISVLLHDTPNCPWEKLGADYFSFAGNDYLLVIDYFSKYPEVVCVNSKIAEATVSKMKQMFSRHGIPNTLVADNMPFNSKTFKQFKNGV